MKKIILSLALAAFLSAGSLAYATTTTSSDQNSETIELMQDGKKKASVTKKSDAKSEKATECKDSKATKSDCKSACKGDDATKKKSCCSDGKASTDKKSNPDKK